MAYIEENDKLKENQNPNQPQSVGGSGGPSVVNQGSNAVGSGVSTAGVGAGGTGKWTNIQAYLNANKDVDTGASDMIKQDAGSQFDQEKSALDADADKQSKAAQDAVKPVSDVKDRADDYLNQATNSYSWDGAHGDGYKKALSAFQGALNTNYAGPKSYGYSMSDKTQQKASALGSDDAFNQYLGDLYQNKAGGQLSSGQRALQTQLNVSNDPLANMRKNLLKQHSGLGEYASQKIKDTDATMAKAASDFSSGQNYLKDFLGNQASSAETSLVKDESDARHDYDKLFNHSREGMNGELQVPKTWSGLADLMGSQKDYTTEQLRDQNFANTLDPFARTGVYDGYRMGDQALQQFYGQQDQKYANTGDLQKRKWNTIKDFIKSGDPRKTQGFKVRG
jgi:hypothetical protein